MWISDDDPSYLKDCPKPQGNDKLNFRSNSPPFEGGESLCEFYADHSDQNEKLKSLHHSTENTHDGFQNVSSNFQGHFFHYNTEEKIPCKNFISLLNQDLLPTNTFTQSFIQSILSSIDSSDPVVANAWMETLLDVIDLLPIEIVKGEILTLAVNKGQLSQPITSRLLCCKMLGKICLKFDPYVIIKEVLPVVLSLCQDVDFEVRGYMCRQLDIISRGVGLETTKSAILSELVELANDEETFVRLAAIETVVQMLPMLDDGTCTQTIIPLVKKFCERSLNSKDSTLPVVSKHLGRLCCGLSGNFSQDQKQWFLGFFQDLSKLGLCHPEKNDSAHFNPLPDLLPEVDHKDRYHECRCACAFNFPAMALFVGPKNFEKELYTTFKELCSDPFQNVRQTMAYGIYEVAKLLEINAFLLHPELVLLLLDDSVEVLKGLIPCLPESLKFICCSTDIQDDWEKKLVKALITCEEAISVTSNWRLHADFLTCLSCLPLCISSETIFTTFVPLLFVKLHTARPIPCRTAAAYSILVFLRNTPSLERRKGIINELIRDLCYGRSCHKRMLFIRICELVIELFSKGFFKAHFFKPLLDLSVDPVPNIRLRLCAILPRLKGLLKIPKDSLLLQQLESCVKTLMADENDKDVSYAVSKVIEELDKIEVAAEPYGLQVSRRSSCIEVVLDLEDRLKENEERQQLELEFNSKFVKENKSFKSPVGASVNKAGKIPVRKSGTLPKQSKAKENQHVVVDKVSSSNSLKSLKHIKKERRISSPCINIECPKNTSKINQANKESNAAIKKPLSATSSKFNIPISRSQSPTTRTWPRQKPVSCIPKQTIDRCPSPMPPPRRFSEQNKLENTVSKNLNCSAPLPARNSLNESLLEASSTERLTKQKFIGRPVNSTPEMKRKEIMRKSSTFTNLHSESKIPTSSKKSMPKES